MKLSVEFPSVAYREGPEGIVRLARALERIGFDQLDIFDHVVMGYPAPGRPRRTLPRKPAPGYTNRAGAVPVGNAIKLLRNLTYAPGPLNCRTWKRAPPVQRRCPCTDAIIANSSVMSLGEGSSANSLYRLATFTTMRSASPQES